MNKLRWTILWGCWVGSLFFAFGLGIWRGRVIDRLNERMAEELNDQGKANARLAIPNPCLKAMWGRPLPTDIQVNIGLNPSGIHYYGDDWLQARLWELAQSQLQSLASRKALPSRADLDLDEFYLERAYRLLPLWKTGQVDIAETSNPWPGDQAPLWGVFLTKPEEAWRRGVNGDGKGGH